MYIIGDIHGCLETLKILYKKIPDKKNIYSVGDIIDKGPDSALVIDFIIKNNIKVIKGNHEALYEIMIEKYLNNEDIFYSKWYKLWGGKNTLNSYFKYEKKIIKKKMIEHLQFIKSLPYYFEIDIKDEDNDTLFISHGFALPYYKMRHNLYNDNNVKQAFLSNRLKSKYFIVNKKNLKNLEKYKVKNIFGHDASNEVRFSKNYIAIDTGCVYSKNENKGKCLTAIHWPSKEIIQVKLKDKINYKDY